MNKKKLISVLALILAVVIAVVAIVISLQSCSKTGDGDGTDTSKPSDSQGSDFDFNYEAEEKEENKPISNKPQGGNIVINRRPVRVNPDYTSVAEKNDGNSQQPQTQPEYTYDIKVTTFELNSFSASTKGIVYNNEAGEDAKIKAEKELTNWITNICKFDADINAFQSIYPTLYREQVGGVKVDTADIFSKVFKDYKAFDNGLAPSSATYLSTLSSKASQYALTDVTSGYLGSKSGSKILYVKGYMTVKGVKIAVYNVRLANGDTTQVKDTWSELIGLMNKEDYCIVMGNMMNSDEIAKYMQKAGFNAANGGKFGDFVTNTWSFAGNYRDNIFTTANIDIQYVEIEPSKNAGLYTNPLSAYLKINTEMGSTKKTDLFGVDANGFIDKWFKP